MGEVKIMDQKLENAIMEQLTNKEQSKDISSQLGNLASELQAKDLGSRLESAFKQTISNSQVSVEGTQFEQSLKSQIMSKDSLTEAFGVSIVPTVTGLVSTLIPTNIGAIGGLQLGSGLGGIIGGWALQKVGKSGLVGKIGKGVVVGSLGNIMAGFSNSLLGGISSGIMPQRSSDSALSGVAF